MPGSVGKVHQSVLRNQVGDAIRRARTDAGMRQPELATALGVSVTTVSEWELGKKLPSLDRRDQIAQALHINIDELCPNLGHVEKLAQNEKVRLDRVSMAGQRRTLVSKREIEFEAEKNEENKRDFLLSIGDFRGFLGALEDDESIFIARLKEIATCDNHDELFDVARQLQEIAERRRQKLKDFIASIK